MVQSQDILRVLVSYQVDFIVVGGVAAVLQGAPIEPRWASGSLRPRSQA
jgi:hypothetical protein